MTIHPAVPDRRAKSPKIDGPVQVTPAITLAKISAGLDMVLLVLGVVVEFVAFELILEALFNEYPIFLYLLAAGVSGLSMLLSHHIGKALRARHERHSSYRPEWLFTSLAGAVLLLAGSAYVRWNAQISSTDPGIGTASGGFGSGTGVADQAQQAATSHLTAIFLTAVAAVAMVGAVWLKYRTCSPLHDDARDAEKKLHRAELVHRDAVAQHSSAASVLLAKIELARLAGRRERHDLAERRAWGIELMNLSRLLMAQRARDISDIAVTQTGPIPTQTYLDLQVSAAPRLWPETELPTAGEGKVSDPADTETEPNTKPDDTGHPDRDLSESRRIA